MIWSPSLWKPVVYSDNDKGYIYKVTDDTSNRLINAWQSQSKVLHLGPDWLEISRVIENVQENHLVSVGCLAYT